jgi:hypothetical protein
VYSCREKDVVPREASRTPGQREQHLRSNLIRTSDIGTVTSVIINTRPYPLSSGEENSVVRMELNPWSHPGRKNAYQSI